jgi:hypothetical protein
LILFLILIILLYLRLSFSYTPKPIPKSNLVLTPYLWNLDHNLHRSEIFFQNLTSRTRVGNNFRIALKPRTIRL